MKVLLIFGTRPEAIKMAPVAKALQAHTGFDPKICTTGQHKEMLQQVMDFFELQADYALSIMQPAQTLFTITTAALNALEGVLNDCQPDVVLVQGDTTTAMAGALAAHYMGIRVGHVEAGLRSGNLWAPFPEEANRKIISTLSHWHFAPTEGSLQNLAKDGYHERVSVTGNTVIDALLWGLKKVKDDTTYGQAFSFLPPDARLILVTAHRRESFGEPFVHICNALLRIAQAHPDVHLVYPVHLNPNVQGIVRQTLQDQPNIHLLPPVSYPELLWLLHRCHLVLTDSGGIQEEAPTLGKPVIVLRDVTERTEGVEAGTATLVGTDEERIVEETEKLLTNTVLYAQVSNAANPYGDGHSAARIVESLHTHR